MAKIISTINLKGGVGKTSITVAIAEILALQNSKKVLLVDLDPQTNATVSVILEKEWERRNKEGHTIYHMFKDRLDKTKQFDINASIVRKVSNVGSGIDGLDILPSSLDLIDIQDRLPAINDFGFFVTSPVTILSEEIRNLHEQYDYILIDCPPNLGIITLNGLYISNYYIIPCIPDILSTYGIPQILKRVNDFKNKADIGIKPLGIVISMYRSQSNLHNSMIRQLKVNAEKEEYPRIFDTVIPMAAHAAEAADINATPNTLKQKYGYGNIYNCYNNLVYEVISNAK